nr:hypothetical protein [Feifania hominis]
MDLIFLAVLLALLLYRKKYMTVAVGVFFGLVYMAVDYGIFHLMLHTRSIQNGYSMFWVLLWMSMSFGFTNFVFIWLWLSRDTHLVEWSVLILSWWVCCPLISGSFGRAAAPIVIERTTGAYHGAMAAMLFVGYLGLVIWNLTRADRESRVNILWLLAIGILVQFGWEAGLLIGGVRSAGFASPADKFATLVVNSLLETNLGMPYVYFLFLAYSRRFTERMRKRRTALSLQERIRENNAQRLFGGGCEFLGD